MAVFSLESLTKPLPGEAPCGPDLDLSGDDEYGSFVAAAEGFIPPTFFSAEDGRPFDRTMVDFATQYEVIDRLWQRTRDLRLLVLLAKFAILDRNLGGFKTALEAIAVLLEREWDGVHPLGDDGDFALRMVNVQALDDMVPVILPLTYVPLFEHRHAGPISYRSYLVAEGEVEPRGDEDKLDIGLVKRAFAETELATLVERRNDFKTIADALARITTAFATHVGIGNGVAFARLSPLVEKIRGTLDSLVVLRDPSSGEAAVEAGEPADATEETQGTGSHLVGDIATLADARTALEAIAAYFERREPSNPALLLVRQAIELVGKSFIDALRVLVPSYVENIKVEIGKGQVFSLPIERLSDFAAIDGAGEDPTADPVTFEVATRDSALRLLKKIGAFYHAAEPSSPVPYLVDRARELTGRDFLGLLREMLPKDTLQPPEPK